MKEKILIITELILGVICVIYQQTQLPEKPTLLLIGCVLILAGITKQ